MSSLVDWFDCIAEKITSLPRAIADALGLNSLFDSIKTRLMSLGENILNLPSSIAQSIKGFFDNIGEKLKEVGQNILDLPDKIIEGIKRIFIPEDGFIQEKLEYLQSSFSSLIVQPYDMSSIMGKETSLSDINGTIRGKTVSFVDMDVVVTVISKFRPVIRGLMWLMLVIYNYNQFMGLIGQQSLTLGGMIRSFERGNEE